MPPQREPISVRTARLNNVILGKLVGVVSKIPGRRSTIGGVTTAVSPAVADAISRESLLDAFCLLYNECDKEVLKRRDRNIAEFVNKYRPIVEETRQLRVNADDFNVKTLIGKGYFGNVHLVVERQTGDVYAMKTIKKSVMTTAQVKEERDIMSRRCSEWITNLQYAFQDNDNLYLVMEFLPGGDLLSLMSRQGPFDEDLARFYLAEMTAAIHALHLMGYVHRDIKPENILIDRFGHIKLADFGNAAALNRDGHVFSLTPVGTPDYIAPELLQTLASFKMTRSQHDVTCDYWSMGVIGYELICETTPFHDDNVHETYSRILSHCDDSSTAHFLTFPGDVKISANFKNLIESLVTSPMNRIGYEKIRKHAYFELVNWEKLRCQVPPIIPTVNGEDDTSNFEDVTRNQPRVLSPTKRPPPSPSAGNVKSPEFSGRDLPFVGYSFVHMETNETTAMSIDERSGLAMHPLQKTLQPTGDEARLNKMTGRMKELALKLKERSEEVSKLKQDLMRAEQGAKHSDSQAKILDDAKREMTKMKNMIKEKTIELAACRTQIKTLQSSLKIEQEMWEKKEATITDLLRLNRQKYEEAKTASEQRYEKLIAEKKSELANIVQKLNDRESELTAKTEECAHFQAKMENYKDMLKQCKDQAIADKAEFEKNKRHLSETYEQKLNELRSKLRHEKDSHCRLTMELKDVRSQLDDTISTTTASQEAKTASAKVANDEILKRLNSELEANNQLHRHNAELEQKVSEAQRVAQEAQLEVTRLERELKVLECGRNLASSTLASTQVTTPYDTAPGSLSDLQDTEEKLRCDLEVAKENETAHKQRADKLQEVVAKLEEMLVMINEQQGSSSPTKKPNGAPATVGDMLERQNEKLEDKLAAVSEQMILERQSARTANLSLWKTEKKLEEVQAEKRMVQRRMELTEERIKRVQAERDEAQRATRAAEAETSRREERIEEMKREIAALKADVHKEHRMWEKAEQERMKTKSEVMQLISKGHSLDERLTEAYQKLRDSQKRCDGLTMESRRLAHELHEEREKCSAAQDAQSAAQIELKNLQDNYERLKYACTITDNQLTEIEHMLETEQQRNRSHQERIDKLNAIVRQKDDSLMELKTQLRNEQIKRKLAEMRAAALDEEMTDLRQSMEELKKKLIAQQQHLMEQTSALFAAQERVEVLSTEAAHGQTMNENSAREIVILKEENTRTLTELFHAKELVHQLQEELKEANALNNDLQAEIGDLQAHLSEKENYFMQRDIKAEATLAQHKKLIDYLQLKVEDLTQRKKKTLTDMIFGVHTSAKKDTSTSGGGVESSILYRTLAEELRREKQRCKNLQEQLDKASGITKTTTSRSPLKENRNPATTGSGCPSPVKSASATLKTKSSKESGIVASANASASTTASVVQPSSSHRFELALQEMQNGAVECVACYKAILSGSPYWKCKECKRSVHRKCRGDVKVACQAPTGPEVSSCAVALPTEIDTDAASDSASLGQYSYEAKMDEVPAAIDGGEGDVAGVGSGDGTYCGQLIYSVRQLSDAQKDLEIKCAHEIEPAKIVLFGCNMGLYAYHIGSQRLVHIAGIDSVSYIAVSAALSKVILVGSDGESLYQCDYRLLHSRCQANACLKPALEASVLDLPFANRSSSEKWQLVRISSEAENPCDSVAIAATSCRIVIMRYDLKMEKFKPVRALDTSTSVSAVLYTRHTAIVSSDKFYEIDLATYAAEEFVDFSDSSLTHLTSCHPVVALRFSRQEFLLCFTECGVFVDEYGCRSRPYDLNWEYTPTGFIYREPFLYISHFQSVQIMRLNRSYTKQISTAVNAATATATAADHQSSSSNAGDDNLTPNLRRVYLPLYMPTLLADSDSMNVYAAAVQKNAGHQQIYLIDPMLAFKHRHPLSNSTETLSSIASSVTMASNTTDSGI